MRSVLLGLLLLLIVEKSFSQITTTYSFTGSEQTWTVPACVSSISVTIAGAEGGGSNGGEGSVVTATIPVISGQVIYINVGGQGSCPGAGYGGGGVGQPSGIGMPSCGGGGASYIALAPGGIANSIAVAGGGGGTGGGDANSGGGDGGCPDGSSGTASFGIGGGGGTSNSGGTGGPPWTPGGGTGGNGSFGQGGAGGIDIVYGNAPGGAGGGGYYGGGGGGSDNISLTSAIGGGGGGAGSSLIPAGGSCTPGTNTGNGYVTITTVNGVSASNTGPYCEGSTIQLNGTAGTTYAWTGPNGFTSNIQNPTIPNATAANAGTYSLTVTGTGCNAAATTNVTVVPQIYPNAGVDDTVCFGFPFQLVGTITVATDVKQWFGIPNGITPNPTIQFLPAANNLTPNVNVNQPGSYSFVLLESNPVCGTKRDTVNIYVKQMDIVTSFTNPSCESYLDGTITLSGTQATEYSFDNGVTWGTNPVGSGFAEGTYNVCVRDVNQCKACASVTLTDPAPIVLSLSNDTLICENGTATLVASAVGGNTYTYSWLLFPTTVDTQYASPAVDTWYAVRAFSELGCPSNLDSIHVTIRPPITGYLTQNAMICPGYPTYLVADSVVGGIGVPYTFTWSTAEIGVGDKDSISVNPDINTTYTVTIKDECETTPLVLSTLVTVAPVPDPMISVDLDNECEPASFVLANATDPLMTGSVIWNISDGQQNLNESFVTDTMMAGTYHVQLIVTSPFGCIDSTTFYNYLEVHAKPHVDFNNSPNPVYMYNPQVFLTNYTTGAVLYDWYIESGSPSHSNLENLSVVMPEGIEAQYRATLVATSEMGCVDSLSKLIIVLPEILLFAPNTFTPDDDEYNQSWGIEMVGLDPYDFELLIFNRWGQIIWESHDPEARWDGTYNNSYVQSGTYTWTIKSKDRINDGTYNFNGYINVLK